jgi:hypothetical protein
MKLRLLSFSLGALLLAAGAFITGCTQTDTPGTGSSNYTDTYGDISGLTVGQTYQFGISGGNSGTMITGVSSYSGTATSGTVRVFWSRASGDSNRITPTATVGSTAGSNIIVWAPASSSGTFRLYETADPSSSHPSGLVLGTTAHTASISGAEASNLDLVLGTDASQPTTQPGLSLVSPDDGRSLIPVGVSVKSTDFASSADIVKGGLPMDKLSSSITFSASGSYDISSAFRDSSSAIIAVRTQDGHYARVEIVPQAASTTFQGNTGHFLWGDTGGLPSYRFVDLNVTYQPTANLAYAGRPVSGGTTLRTHRTSSGNRIVK